MPCSLKLTTPASFFPPPSEKIIAPSLSTVLVDPPCPISPILQAQWVSLDELELLHHYTTTTCFSLADGQRNIDAWKLMLPRIALEYPYLMHGILALSALHLSSLDTYRAPEWSAKASLHEALALPEFRAAMSSITKDTSHAIFAFSGIVIPYAQAIATTPIGPEASRFSDPGVLPEWFYLLRGTRTLLRQTRPWLEEGPFSTWFQRSEAPIDCTLNPDDCHLIDLSPRLAISRAAGANPETDFLTCCNALEELRKVSALPFSPYHEYGDKSIVLIWPLAIPEEFIHLVQTKSPDALIILAHYCVLLAQVQPSWFLHHQAEQMLCAIAACLDESMQSWLKWPQHRVGALSKLQESHRT